MTTQITTTKTGAPILTPGTPAQYRKNRNDVWVVLARHSDLLEAEKLGAAITVTKKNGDTKVEAISRIGKPFEIDGDTYAYGYINDGWYTAELDGPAHLYQGAAR